MIQTFTSADADYSSMYVYKSLSGRTITYSGGTGVGGLGLDSSYLSPEGLYAYEGANGGNDIRLTVSIDPGYTFDINSFRAGVSSGTLNVALTYGNGTTETFIVNGLNNSWQLLSGFSRPINDVKQVVLTSNDFGLFQDFDVNDVQPITSAPVVTDATVSIGGASGTGGAYKIGDTVTATWNNTAGGDNNTGTLSSVRFDFSQFGGGSAVAASNSGGVWSATYTIVSGSIDATNRNVSISVADNAGNTTTVSDSTNATVDNVSPTVTDARISISGASGTGGAYRIGDTVTATWDNTAGGDNNTDTISGVRFDLSQFGGGSAVAATNSGGTWTATYTIVSGSMSVTNRNVAVSVTDNAGNLTIRADSTNATVDNTSPTITIGSVSLSADTGASSADLITKTAAQTIVATLSGALSVGDVLYGSLDNGATWADITGTVSGTSLTWTGVTLSGSNTMRFKVVDGAGNQGASTSQAYTVDTAAPNAPSISSLAAASDTGRSQTDRITSDTTPTVNGIAEANSVVTLFDSDGTTSLGTTTADASGNWTIVSSALSEGTHSLTARSSDVAGNASITSAAMVVAIDTSNPVINIATPSTVSNSSFTITGSVDDINAVGATLTLREGDVELGTAVVSASGSWSTSVNLGSTGRHQITASVTDVAGNTGETQTAFVVSPPTGSNGLPNFTPGLYVQVLDGLFTLTNRGGTQGFNFSGGNGSPIIIAGTNFGTPPLIMNSGKLLVNGSIDSPLTVKSSATLGGHGTTGTVTVEAGGTLSPGNSPGVLTTLDLTLAADATLKQEIVGTAQGQFDQTKVIGTVSLDGATLDLASFGSFVSARNDRFVIIDNDGSDAVQGTFAGLANGASLTLGARAYQINYRGGDGNDVVLTDVTMPDAATLALFGKVETNPASQTGGVYALYQALLGRAPDALGLQKFSADLQAGAAITEVAAAILGSAERGGTVNDPTAYVQALYTNALHRSADNDGLKFYVDKLNAGISQATVAAQIATSAEAQGVNASAFSTGVFVSDALSSAVARLYYGVLGRAPDAVGLQGFEAQVKQGAAIGGVDGAVKGLAGVVSTMLGSQEYTSTHTDQTSASFVDSLYFGALGRHADAGGLAFYTNELAQGVSQAQVVLQIAQSAEAQAHLANQIELGWHLV